MRPKTYQILSDSVQEGVRLGLARAVKLDVIEEPSDWLLSEVSSTVMACICEYFTFDDQE